MAHEGNTIIYIPVQQYLLQYKINHPITNIFIPVQQYLSQYNTIYPVQEYFSSTKIFITVQKYFSSTKIFIPVQKYLSQYKWGMGTNFPEGIATFLEAHVNMAAPFPACFCHCCSFKIVDPAYRYCPKCGAEVFRVASSAESTGNTTEPPDSPKTRKFFFAKLQVIQT